MERFLQEVEERFGQGGNEVESETGRGEGVAGDEALDLSSGTLGLLLLLL